MHCPNCDFGKYSSLPFGNIATGTGATVYRCLRCEFLFAQDIRTILEAMPLIAAPGLAELGVAPFRDSSPWDSI